MSSQRRLRCGDLLRFNSVNLDALTETYNLCFYLQYMSMWPGYQVVMQNTDRTLMAYMIGKAEGKQGTREWHGHVSAVTVGAPFRRLGHARALMHQLEQTADSVDGCFFVDLFVRVSNLVAIHMYEQMGYVVYRRIVGYYSGEEDALDMRKALSRDPKRLSMVPLPRPVLANELRDLSM
ncbi:N-terminal acetyltransferase B complex catalytic subunit NAA20 [Porphyridium purpureum]|uniref:N-terminal acetyltransferase B complex catalytic subunit NAA20 n=1 Tax=Porphyridium purpureum TaxID=35688 RepID=A0A5J4Z3K4_PORPP|nr:N-terminal acetyltransferase B complex catalytic subunit NAA20 [Porphyridium purpureum]|eukprot:POR0855..scf295_1